MRIDDDEKVILYRREPGRFIPGIEVGVRELAGPYLLISAIKATRWIIAGAAGAITYNILISEATLRSEFRFILILMVYVALAEFFLLIVEPEDPDLKKIRQLIEDEENP